MQEQATSVIRVMIVDDDEIAVMGIRTVLNESSDIEVVAQALDGATAVSAAIESAPHVVIMDIRMPTMNGIAATKQIKEKLCNTRVLMLTSSDNQEDTFASLAAGADGYCVKNTSAKQLIRAVQAIHSGATWLDPHIARLVLTAASSPAAVPPSKQAQNSPFALSPREMEVLQALVDGLSNREIAERLVISSETVKTHMRHIMEKLVVSDRTQAALKALQMGMV